MEIENPTPLPKMTFWQMIRQGQIYRKTFPNIKVLSLIFREFHIIKVTQFAINFMPPLAVLCICWALMLNANLAIATTAATFALSIPVQCLYWLGKRATSKIPSPLYEWIKEVHQKLLESDQTPPPLPNSPTYLEFAAILKFAFDHLEDDFLENL